MDPERARAASGFNPRIRKGCDIGVPQIITADPNVSIHASVKDATWLLLLLYRCKVSIHASVKDATFGLEGFLFPSISFQSTHP